MIDEDDEAVPLPVPLPRRWRWAAAIGATVNAAGNMGRAVTAWCDDISTLLAQHTAAEYDREDFADAIHATLESLPES